MFQCWLPNLKHGSERSWLDVILYIVRSTLRSLAMFVFQAATVSYRGSQSKKNHM